MWLTKDELIHFSRFGKLKDKNEATGEEGTDMQKKVVEEDSKSENSQSEPLIPKFEKVPEDLLVLLLEEDCSEEISDFALLSKPDRLVCELLESIKFLDVQLAVVAHCVADINQEVAASSKQEEEYFWIEEWQFCSKIGVPHTTQFQVDKNQVIVGMKKLLTKGKNSRNSIVYHWGLVIQPRRQSVHLGCEHNVDFVLDLLRCLANSPTDKNILISTLGQVIGFCRQEPSRVWNDPPENNRAKQLMELCTQLGAKQEGLDLLDALGDEFQLDSQQIGDEPELSYEGIRDSQVAQAIADFQSCVSGKNLLFFKLLIILLIILLLFRRLERLQ